MHGQRCGCVPEPGGSGVPDQCDRSSDPSYSHGRSEPQPRQSPITTCKFARCRQTSKLFNLATASSVQIDSLVFLLALSHPAMLLCVAILRTHSAKHCETETRCSISTPRISRPGNPCIHQRSRCAEFFQNISWNASHGRSAVSAEDVGDGGDQSSSFHRLG